MRRIAVIGCGGSGKTTLGRALAAALGLPLLHVDAYRFHAGVHVPDPEWRERHARLLAGEEWVLEGMRIGSTLDERLDRADAVVFLDLSTRACLAGILRRRLRHRGRDRPELGVYDRITVEFLRWVLGFRRRTRPAILAALDRHPDTTAIVVPNRRQARPEIVLQKLSQFADFRVTEALRGRVPTHRFPHAASTERE